MDCLFLVKLNIRENYSKRCQQASFLLTTKSEINQWKECLFSYQHLFWTSAHQISTFWVSYLPFKMRVFFLTSYWCSKENTDCSVWVREMSGGPWLETMWAAFGGPFHSVPLQLSLITEQQEHLPQCQTHSAKRLQLIPNQWLIIREEAGRGEDGD